MPTTNDDDHRHLPVPYSSAPAGARAPGSAIVPAPSRLRPMGWPDLERPQAPVPAGSHGDWVARSPVLVIPVGDGVPSTHTGPEARVLREVADPVVGHPPRPFAAKRARPAFTREPSRRIGWALVIATLAEMVVAGAAIATASYLIGFVSVVCMALCGMVLVIAESIGRGADR